MRSKVLELIYKRLQNPTTKNVFHKISENQWFEPPFKQYYNSFIHNESMLSFRLKFSDGKPDICVYTERTDNIIFLKWHPFGPKFRTYVKCDPLVFELSPLEVDVLSAEVKEYQEKHLYLAYQEKFDTMSAKILSRLEKND
jgi:hypothetical protein